MTPDVSGIILCMHPANERRHDVTSSLIGWVHAQNDPWLYEAWPETSDDRGSFKQNIDSLVQDCSNSTANALELLESCTKPSA